MSHPEVSPAGVRPSRSQVPLARKLNYSTGMFGLTALGMFQVTLLLLFYTETVGLKAYLVGSALMVGRIWDAVTDPAMGNISDRTTLAMGRRRPYMLFGAVPLAVSYIALWTPPVGWSQQALFLYLLFTYIAFSTFITVVTIPYVSLGAELSTDYHERTRIMAVRMVFQTLGWYLATNGLALNEFAEDLASRTGGVWRTVLAFREGYAVTAVLFGVVSVVAMVWTVVSVKEDPELRARPRIGQLSAFWQTLTNRSFLLLILAFLGATVINSIGMSFFPYLMGYWYYQGDLSTMGLNLPKLMLPMLLVGLPGYFFWTFVSRRMGKKNAYLFGLGSLVVIEMLNFVMITPHAPWLFWPWAVLFGLVVSCTNLLIPAIIPDIVDQDELATGARREGSFFGMHTFALKLASAFGIFMAGLVLPLIGFVEGAEEQSHTTILLLRVFYAFVRAGGLALAFVVLLRFPLTPQRVARVRALLDARRQTQASEETEIHVAG